MARTRSIKPQFFIEEDIGALKPLERLLFIGLWTIADRRGLLEDKPRQIKNALLGYDDCDVDEMLGALNGAGFILRYKSDSKSYIKIKQFVKHQNPHRDEKATDIPEPSEILDKADLHHTSTVQAPCLHHTSTEEAQPITGNLLPITGNLLPIEATKELPSSEYAYECAHFRVKHEQFNKWSAIFRTIDVLESMRGMHVWYDKQLAEGKLNEKQIKTQWFFQLPQAFAKEDMKRKTAMGGASL
jgi:hypothetical protein